MKIEDLDKLVIGDALVCTKVIPKSEIKIGQTLYFITYYNYKGIKLKPTLYLSKIPVNSDTNPSEAYNPGIIEYFEMHTELRNKKINKILE